MKHSKFPKLFPQSKVAKLYIKIISAKRIQRVERS